MKAPVIRGFDRTNFHLSRQARGEDRRDERGVTMALVAISMVAIISIAALSVDVVTLLLAREEAQRAADAGALAAARMISFSGLTGDPNNTSGVWACVCGSGCTANGQTIPPLATTAADAAAEQSTVSGAGGNAATFLVSVNYLAAGGTTTGPTTDCTGLSGTNSTFSVNPMVTVQVTRTGLPTFFSRIWGNTGNTTNGSATAEAFNPSYSASVGSGAITPVQPRCVKPWFVPNQDPLNPSSSCTGGSGGSCLPFINTSAGAQGQIVHSGVSIDGTGNNGVIGEEFTLFPDCKASPAGSCQLHSKYGTQPQANYTYTPGGPIPQSPNLAYVPGQVSGASVAVPSGLVGNYEGAIGGCDQTTVYQCGVPNANIVDLSVNPGQPTGSGPTTTAVMALIHEGNPTATQPDGQDYFSTYGKRTTEAPQILAGSSNPLGISNAVSASNSIVSLPIYDSANNMINPAAGTTTTVTVVGFLQVFINGVEQNGNVDVSVMNVVGCGNGNGTTLNPAVTGSSPVPVRLITPPSS